MNLRIGSDGAIHLSAPYGVSRAQVEAMVRGHEDWIHSHQRQMRERGRRASRTFSEGEKLLVWGTPRTIVFASGRKLPGSELPSGRKLPGSELPPHPSSGERPDHRRAAEPMRTFGEWKTSHADSASASPSPATGPSAFAPTSAETGTMLPAGGASLPEKTARSSTRATPHAELQGNHLVLHLPAARTDDSPESVEYRKDLVLDLFAEEVQLATERIYPRCSAEVDARASSITVRYMASRWGSCTPKTRRIRLNSALAAYDPHCLEQVLIHELCHIHEPNHSARFWALMDRHCPGWRRWQAELKSREPFEAPQG